MTVNAPTGEAQVLISKGLKPEEKIVIAGVYQLVEGENVKDIVLGGVCAGMFVMPQLMTARQLVTDGGDTVSYTHLDVYKRQL